LTSEKDFPATSALVPLIVESIKANGGSAHFKVIEDYVAKKIEISEDLRTRIRSGGRTEFAYRLSWARTQAKSDGLIANSGSGIWTTVNP
jgi:restriction system protein